MKITSSAFGNNAIIPSKYTCYSEENINPPLSFEAIPKEAKSLVLIMDDPDAVSGVWVHWVIFNIPPDTQKIEENSTPPGIEGTTSFGKVGYGGPCPPNVPPHRYFFKLYALDTMLENNPAFTKEDLEKMMQEHVLESCKLIGLFQKPQ